MKLKNLFLAALAGSMVFASCTSEETVAPVDKKLKSVKVTLPNLQMDGTRAVGTGIAASSKAILKDYKIFFLDAQGTIVPVPDVNDEKNPTAVAETDGVEQETYFSSDDVTANGKTVTYHFLPSRVAKVAVVGNLGDEANYTASFTNLNAFLAKTFDVQNDNYSTTTTTDATLTNNETSKNPYYVLFGIDEDLTRNQTGHLPHLNVYDASVNLAPAVARLEIVGFGYGIKADGDGLKYTTVSLDKIALANYYDQYKFNTTETNGPANVGDLNIPSTGIKEENAFQLIETAAAPWADKLPAASTDGNAVLTLTTTDGTHVYKFANGIDGTSETVFGSATTSLDNIITYSIVNNSAPQLLISLTGQKTGVEAVPHYLWVNKFKDGDSVVSKFEAGKIYRTVIDFEDVNLQDPLKCIELQVIVHDWTVVPVTPEFSKPGTN